jgi:pyrrolidone-carboxylate peptidase
MRLLVYGFGPYREFKDNVTGRILRHLPRRSGLKKIVFPVRFHKRQFINVLKAHNPDIVLGLGQCSSGRHLRIESRALNRGRNHPHEKAGPIVPGGRRELKTDFKLDLGRRARRSKNAGDYVCNYSMYLMLDFIKRRGLKVRFGFIHIPCSYDPWTAARLLLKALDKLKTPARSVRRLRRLPPKAV